LSSLKSVGFFRGFIFSTAVIGSVASSYESDNLFKVDLFSAVERFIPIFNSY
jgi:biotin transporter BioY